MVGSLLWPPEDENVMSLSEIYYFNGWEFLIETVSVDQSYSFSLSLVLSFPGRSVHKSVTKSSLEEMAWVLYDKLMHSD